jgi:hypothetical protein
MTPTPSLILDFLFDDTSQFFLTKMMSAVEDYNMAHKKLGEILYCVAYKTNIRRQIYLKYKIYLFWFLSNGLTYLPQPPQINITLRYFLQKLCAQNVSKK